MKEQVWMVYVHKNSVFIIKFYIPRYISKIELYHVRFHELGYLGKFWKVFFLKKNIAFIFSLYFILY